jgi:hypothetical protein
MRTLAAVFLAAWTLVALPAATASAPAVWSGTWQTNWGPLTLTPSGTVLVGKFGYADSWNEPLGHITNATASGSVLTGTWSHDQPSHFAPRDHGTFSVTWSYANGVASFEGTATYQVDGTKADFFGTCKTGACAADFAPPSVKALRTSGKAGSLLRLRWRVSDDRGKTTDLLRVYRGTKKLWSYTRTHRGVAGVTYTQRYRTPQKAGTLKLVVKATDRAGNSATSTARITLR